MDKIEAALAPLDQWAQRCHEASLRLVKSGVVPGARVARGAGTNVGSQHSWVVVGDPYDDKATIIDPTLWSYDDSVEGIWVGTYQDGRHTPHGKGTIWKWGRPLPAEGPPVELPPPEGGWSDHALSFLSLLGPLDERGWRKLAHAPVEGWPAAEIIGQIDLKYPGVVPIDIIGMLTDRNPNGLYLKEDG